MKRCSRTPRTKVEVKAEARTTSLQHEIKHKLAAAPRLEALGSQRQNQGCRLSMECLEAQATSRGRAQIFCASGGWPRRLPPKGRPRDVRQDPKRCCAHRRPRPELARPARREREGADGEEPREERGVHGLRLEGAQQALARPTHDGRESPRRGVAAAAAAADAREDLAGVGRAFPEVFLPGDTRASNVKRNELDRMHGEFDEFAS